MASENVSESLCWTCPNVLSSTSLTALEHRPVFDKRYFDAIGAPDAWHIIPEEDFDAGESSSGTRPTHSALRVKELAEQLAGEFHRRRRLPVYLEIDLYDDPGRSISTLAAAAYSSVPPLSTPSSAAVLRRAHHLRLGRFRVALVRSVARCTRADDGCHSRGWGSCATRPGRSQCPVDGREVCRVGRGCGEDEAFYHSDLRLE